MTSFKENFTLQKRTEESSCIRKKYPDRIPVIVEKLSSSDIETIDKKKFLVPADLTLGQFLYVIRKRIQNLKPEQAIFIFINNSLVSQTSLMSQLYKEHHDTDGFLYAVYSGENTFG